MTLKAKKRFFRKNSFWCQLHGIWYDHVNNIDGNFVRYSKKCEVDLRKWKPSYCLFAKIGK